MDKKVFRTWDDGVTDALIGGSRRLARQRVPEIFQGLRGLVNPGDPGDAERFRQEVTGREVVVEIGPGKGAFLCAMATRRPHTMMVGFEVRLAFCVKTLQRALKQGLHNVRLVWGDARATLPLVLDPGSVREVYLLYPDPWWKRSQAARRYGPVLAGLLARVLMPRGVLVLKSDVQEYLSELLAIFHETGQFEPHLVPPDLPPTDRERKMTLEGCVGRHGVRDGDGMMKGFAAALLRR